MSTTKVQAPRKLTEEETLDTFEDWWFQVECYYSRDPKFADFFDNKTIKWKSRADEHRGLSKAEDASNLNTLLRALATYTSGPYVKSELLDDTRSLKDVRRVFLRFLEIEVTDHSLLNYYTISRQPSERPLVFYHRLRYHILQHHLPEGTKLSNTKTLDADEAVSTTMERFIIMEWLHRLDSRLIKFIQEKFAAELSSNSTYLISMVDSLAKNVDKYITQMDNTSSINMLATQQGQLQSTHGGPEFEEEETSVMFSRGGFHNNSPSQNTRGVNRQQFDRFRPVRQQRSTFGSGNRFNQQSLNRSRCEYCFMQAKGQGKTVEYNHDISNCPQMIAKFSKINLTSVPDQESDTEDNQEYVNFYEEQL